MRMAADDSAVACGARIEGEFVDVVKDEKLDRADSDDGGLRKAARPDAAIVVAPNGDDLGDGAQGVNDFRFADISRVDNQIDARKRAEYFRPDEAVRVGDDSYDFCFFLRRMRSHLDNHLCAWGIHYLKRARNETRRSVMAGVVDADTHIAESANMWEMIEGEMYPRRPVVVSVPEDTLYGRRNAFWLIDGNIFPRPAGKGSFRLITPSASRHESSRGDIHIGSRELTNPQARLADMDKLGVELQVIYPTLFLVYLTDDPALDVALCRAYNRYLAEACGKANGRLRWVMIPPLRSIEESVKEISWAKDHGAVGVFFRGLEGDKTLDNPYFYPVYQTANDLDLPICVHTAIGNTTLLNLIDVERNHSFLASRVLPLVAFRDIVANKIPELFPRLRFGFIEASAGWIPFLFHILKRLLRDRWKYGSSADLFRDYRLFVACEADEDVAYLARYTGEDHLIIGSDYGHNDPSAEHSLVATMRSRADIPAGLTEKILCDNARRLYAL